MRITWIYAIRAGGYGGDLKIGRSDDPIARLAKLQIGNSEGLEGIAAWRGPPEEEGWLQEYYAPLHLRGEWFMHALPMFRYVRMRGGDFAWR